VSEVAAPPQSLRVVDSAIQAAEAAARASGVQIRELAEVDDLQRLCVLVDSGIPNRPTRR
jgi:hypothetical protein